MRAQIEMRPERHGDAAVRSADGARHEGGHEEIAAAPAILFRHRYAGIALLGQAFPDPGRKVVGTLNFSAMRLNFFLRKGVGAFISKLMFLREFKVHGRGRPF